MRPSTSHRIKTLTSNVTVSPAELSLWNKLMGLTINSKVKVTKRVLTVNLLKTLKEKNIGTNEIEHHLKNKSWNNHWSSKMRKCMLNVKIDHANVELSKARSIFSRQYKHLIGRWGHNNVISSRFKQLMQNEVEYYWESGKAKNNEKVKHLKEKWNLYFDNKYKKANVDTWKDIAISDKALKESLGEKETVVAAYGGVDLSEEEKKVLKLPPKFTTFEQLSKVMMETAVEVLNAKIRMENRARERREGRPWSPDEEYDDILQRTVYDAEDAIMDFAKRRVTDLSFCRRINVPKAQSVPIETVLANIKSEILAEFGEFMSENCDQFGNIRAKNLTGEEISRIKSLKNRVKQGQIMITNTDKSGKLSVNTLDNYIHKMQPHISNEELISWTDKQKIENVLNGHTIQFGRILRIGDRWEHWGRVQNSLRNNLCHIPVL